MPLFKHGPDEHGLVSLWHETPVLNWLQRQIYSCWELRTQIPWLEQLAKHADKSFLYASNMVFNWIAVQLRQINDVTFFVEGWVVEGWVVEGWVVEGWVVEGWVVEGWVVEGWVAEGWVAEGWVIKGWVAVEMVGGVEGAVFVAAVGVVFDVVIVWRVEGVVAAVVVVTKISIYYIKKAEKLCSIHEQMVRRTKFLKIRIYPR